MGRRIVVALGGNALGNTPEEQREVLKGVAANLADLIEQGNEVIVSHGNGPQVGMIHLGMQMANGDKTEEIPYIPMPECCAMSQGYIGYHIQNALQTEFLKRGIHKSVGTVVTQVAVRADDPDFDNPTKPIGKFYTEEEAKAITARKGYIMKQDSNRGYRRRIASPRPVDILEKDMIETLVKAGCVVIAGGGGGIPLVETDRGYEGVAAVIDKDATSGKMAELLDADSLMLLTAVDKVAVRYNQPDQTDLKEVTVRELKKYREAGEFAPGSMLPKVNAALRFVESKAGRESLITSVEKAAAALKGLDGTKITG